VLGWFPDDPSLSVRGVNDGVGRRYCQLADRFKQGEVQDGLTAAGYRGSVTWRGFGWRDGAEDIGRFQRAVYDRRIAAPESLLLRSALSDAICLSDPAGNLKLAKGHSRGRIDPAAAAVLAVAEGQRMATRPVQRARMAWA
jgi:phage terminase large subunit-like protein